MNAMITQKNKSNNHAHCRQGRHHGDRLKARKNTKHYIVVICYDLRHILYMVHANLTKLSQSIFARAFCNAVIPPMRFLHLPNCRTIQLGLNQTHEPARGTSYLDLIDNYIALDPSDVQRRLTTLGDWKLNESRSQVLDESEGL